MARPLPREVQEAVLLGCLVGTSPRRISAEGLRAVSALDSSWRAAAAPARVARLLAATLRSWCPRRREHRAPNQVSTYELLVRVERFYRRRSDPRGQGPSGRDWERWTAQLDRELRASPAAYGAYAELNQWSPRCTSEQLWRMARRIHAVYSAGLARA